MYGRRQTGLVAGSSIDDYFNDIIRKHELTLPAKENDRIRHMKEQMAQPGMVFLTYRKVDDIDALIREVCNSRPPDASFTDEMEVLHELWVLEDENIIHQLTSLFTEKVPYSYIADGHHRSAASAKVGAQIRQEKGHYTGEEPFNYFLSCLFPSDQLQIIDYNRVVKDLNGYTPNTFLEALNKDFEVTPCPSLQTPPSPHHFSMYLKGQWYSLKGKLHTFDDQDPILSLIHI
jgi:uncharacterized protein (DUF1015 family)